MQNSNKTKSKGKKGLGSKNLKAIIIMIIMCLTNLLFSEIETIVTENEEQTIVILNDISEGSDKVIIASPIDNGYRANVRAYERVDNVWLLRHHTEGFFGRSGVTEDKMEGDGATPIGVFTFGRAFGIAEDPGSLLPYTKVTENDIWVDDVKSSFYNQWNLKDNPEADWDSYEDLIKYEEAYKYSLTINYNTDPIVTGKGSAIFLHCSTGRPTAGCISVSDDSMLFLLSFVDENTRIGIFNH